MPFHQADDPAYPAWFFPATRERIRNALEAADEANLSGLYSLRDRLVDLARSEAADLDHRLAA